MIFRLAVRPLPLECLQPDDGEQVSELPEIILNI